MPRWKDLLRFLDRNGIVHLGSIRKNSTKDSNNQED